MSMGWRDEAECRNHDADLWFQPEESPETAQAVTICVQCPAREACLEFALVMGEDVGVWGGLRGRERTRMRRRIAV